jgi:Rhodopirellula transposase DDE domain
MNRIASPAPCGDVTQGDEIPGMALRQYAATTTKAGLRVESALDTATYQKGIKVSNAEMKTLDIQGDAFHPEWNYTIRPRSAANRST